jgi:hypothetical protein
VRKVAVREVHNRIAPNEKLCHLVLF